MMIPIARRTPQNDEMDECIFGYDAAPYSIFGQVLALNETARSAWPQVTAPALLLYAEADAVVDAALCREAAGKLPSIEEAYGFQKSEHNLLLGCDRAETIQRCAAFIRRHRLDFREGGLQGSSLGQSK
jgi:pimeloyl-ACP methyl ester carboxylesterase